MALTFTRGTQLKFNGEGDADVAWSIEATTTNNGRQSAQQALVTAARTALFHWRAFFQCQATPTLGEVVTLYLKTGETATTHLDNDDGTGDIAISSIDKLKNLDVLGVVIVDEAAANVEIGKPGLIEIFESFFHILGWNTTGATLHATDANSGLLLTEIDYADA